jgi:RNA dependent RNA polymerase
MICYSSYRSESRDLYAVIQNPDLLPPSPDEPAEYASAGTKTLERDSTVHDICDFIVEYIISDVLVSRIERKGHKHFAN